MAKYRVLKPAPGQRRRRTSSGRWITAAGLLFVVAVLALVVLALVKSGSKSPVPATNGAGATPATVSGAPAAGSAGGTAGAESPGAVMEINQAVMVTVELDFGGRMPSIAEALKYIERRHQPADGAGRVFAILDAYGGPTPDGKKLHLSMHVSTEKPGYGALVFRRTGAVLWESRVVQGTKSSTFSRKKLTLLLDNGKGRTLMVDGSHNPASILDARLRDTGQLIRDFWPDNEEREVTFIYSACGCPVKAMVRRIGERTVRTSDSPVLFPDDPAVMVTIRRLMGW